MSRGLVNSLQKYRLYFSIYICSIKIEELIKFFSLILPTFRRFYFSNYQNSLNFLLASLFESFHVSNYFHLYISCIFHFPFPIILLKSSSSNIMKQAEQAKCERGCTDPASIFQKMGNSLAGIVTTYVLAAQLAKRSS